MLLISNHYSNHIFLDFLNDLKEDQLVQPYDKNEHLILLENRKFYELN